jgi:cell filamentation protein
MGKDGNMFCYPEQIPREMKALFAAFTRDRFFRHLSRAAFVAKGAHFLATLNAIHPFREGNGRAQTTFFALLSDRAGHPLALETLDPDRLLHAMIRSFQDDEQPLAEELYRLAR